MYPLSSPRIRTAVHTKPGSINFPRVLPATMTLLPFHGLLPNHLPIVGIGRDYHESPYDACCIQSLVCPFCPTRINCVREIQVINPPLLGKIHPVDRISKGYAIACFDHALDEDMQLWIWETRRLHSKLEGWQRKLAARTETT